MRFSINKLTITVGYETVAALTAVLLLDTQSRMISCFAAALLHEMGHLAMMRLCGVSVRSLSFGLFDALIRADPPPSFASDVWITLGGVMANFLLAAFSFAFSRQFCLANIALGVFNLLPVMSLDGGHLLYICLQRRLLPHTCEILIRAVSFVILLPFLTAGIWLLLRSGYNYSLLAASLYLLAVLILK